MTHAIRNAIFAGGGSRCFWQLGFWQGANDTGLALDQSVDYAASTSAGCAIATAVMLNRGQEALEIFKAATARNPSNIHWRNLRPGSNSPVLPHMAMFREALASFLSPADLIALQPKTVEFLISRPPVYLPSSVATFGAFCVYGLEKKLTGAVHPSWTQKLGFAPLIRGNRDAETITDLRDMILAASSVPPVLPSPAYGGKPALDGGLIDNVPAFLADGRSGRTLILLSKRYRKPLPTFPNRVYVQPSEAIGIDKFDYANPVGLQSTFELGLKDGRRFANSFDADS